MNRNPFKMEAEKLRDAGYSYNMIYKHIGIAKSTLSNWFRDRPFKPNIEVLKRIQYGPVKSAEKSHNRKVREIQKLKQVGTREVGKFSERDLWLLGLGLYIGEGTKAFEKIRIINSDPSVIKLAVKWFKKICGLANENITVTLHLYLDNNLEECINFWSEATQPPRGNFRKTQIDLRQNKSKIKRNKLPYGTAHIAVISGGIKEKGVQLYRRMNGWMLGALSQV
ncbi:MAG: hypothetical protein HYT37_03850 [Candidatus Sungbacteria bacterium]|nr:hypothetical protein [Candidatus Sungbacteria bacterium]